MTYSPEEKEIIKRRITPVLALLVAVKGYTLAVMRASLMCGRTEYDPQEVYRSLRKARDDFAQKEGRYHDSIILKLLQDAHGRPATAYELDDIHRRWDRKYRLDKKEGRL